MHMYQITHTVEPSLVPRPSRAPARKEGLVFNVRFLGCAESACVRKLTVMRTESDSHMTAVAHLFHLSSARCTAHTSKKEELLLTARARRSAWKDAYQQLGGMACSTYVKLLLWVVIAQSLNSLYNRFTNSNVVDVGDRRESGYNPNGRHPHPYYPDTSARSLT